MSGFTANCHKVNQRGCWEKKQNTSFPGSFSPRSLFFTPPRKIVPHDLSNRKWEACWAERAPSTTQICGSPSTFLRCYRFPPSAVNVAKLAAVMYLKVLFFVAVVALTGAFSGDNSGEFATCHCGARRLAPASRVPAQPASNIFLLF